MGVSLNAIAADQSVVIVSTTLFSVIQWGYHYQTRSTPREKTSATLKLRIVKQSSHTWNRLSQNLPECPLFQIRYIAKISLKSVHPCFCNVAMDPCVAWEFPHPVGAGTSVLGWGLE